MWLFRKPPLYLSGFSLNVPFFNGYFLAALAVQVVLCYAFSSFFLFPAESSYHDFATTFLLQVFCLLSQR